MLERTARSLTGWSKRLPHFTGQPEYFAGFLIILLIIVVIIAWHVTVGATEYALQTFVNKRFRRKIPAVGRLLLHAAIMLVILFGIGYIVWRAVDAFFGTSLMSAG